jgi:glycosyltransferase involved in cell wall biosynthesis
MSEKNILAVLTSYKRVFQNNDVKCLSKHFHVDVLSIDTIRQPRFLFAFLFFLKFLIKNRYDYLLLWFSMPKYTLPMSILAKLFKIKIIVISGGWDIAFDKNINWGQMKNPLKRISQKGVFSLAEHILAFSEFSKKDIIKYCDKNKCDVLYFDIDTNVFRPDELKRNNTIITTCFEVDEITFIQKGINLFIDCAKLLPDFKFVIVGRINDNCRNLLTELPANLTITNRFINRQELVELYQSAVIYLQASAHEGFGIAAAEAMSCGCIPIGTRNTSLEEVIGDAGFLFDYNDLEGVLKLINIAMNDKRLSSKARERIEKYFPLGTRDTQLLKYFDQN